MGDSACRRRGGERAAVERMTAEPTPSTRIGDDERAEAHRLLQQHLNAGRLQLAEFVERFAVAADAVTAADLAALFADLPSPHPTLTEPPLRRTRRNLVIVGALVALTLVGLFGFVIGQVRTGSALPAGATPTPTMSPVAQSAGQRVVAMPDNATVRRTTGPGSVTLYPSEGIDLDDVTSPTWNVGAGCCGRDVGFGSDARQLSIDDGHAVVNGPPGFATCFHETAYTTSAIELGSLQPGTTLCVRTNGHRLALITMVNVSQQMVEFGVTVWDPPVPSS